MNRHPRNPTLFPTPPPSRSDEEQPSRPGRRPEPTDAPTSHETRRRRVMLIAGAAVALSAVGIGARYYVWGLHHESTEDRKSTRLNSSHPVISHAVFCLKKQQ